MLCLDTDTPGHYPCEAMQVMGGKGFSLKPIVVPLLSVPLPVLLWSPFVSVMPLSAGTPLRPPAQGHLSCPPRHVPPLVASSSKWPLPPVPSLSQSYCVQSSGRHQIQGEGQGHGTFHTTVSSLAVRLSTELLCFQRSGGRSNPQLTASWGNPL